MQVHPTRCRAICGGSRATLPNEEGYSGGGRRASGVQGAVADRKAKRGLGCPVSRPDHGDPYVGHSLFTVMGFGLGDTGNADLLRVSQKVMADICEHLRAVTGVRMAPPVQTGFFIDKE